jgi:hypothetical protein
MGIAGQELVGHAHCPYCKEDWILFECEGETFGEDQDIKPLLWSGTTLPIVQCQKGHRYTVGILIQTERSTRFGALRRI